MRGLITVIITVSASLLIGTVNGGETPSKSEGIDFSCFTIKFRYLERILCHQICGIYVW